LYIISKKKINRKNLHDKGIEDLKIIYFSYMIFYYAHENKYLENAESYKSIYDVLKKHPEVKASMPQTLEFGFSLDMTNLLENYVLFLVLCTYNNEQVKYLLDLKASYADSLETQPRLERLVDAVLSTELVSTNIEDYSLTNLEAFSAKNEHSALHLKTFRKQLIQHNLRIIEKYYDKITIDRIAQLVGVDNNLAESELCEMINNKLVYAKINRLDGVIIFKQKKNENEFLNEWRFDVHKILDLVDSSSNLINREYDINAQA